MYLLFRNYDPRAWFTDVFDPAFHYSTSILKTGFGYGTIRGGGHGDGEHGYGNGDGKGRIEGAFADGDGFGHCGSHELTPRQLLVTAAVRG